MAKVIRKKKIESFRKMSSKIFLEEILAIIHIGFVFLIFSFLMLGCSEEKTQILMEDKVVNTFREIRGGLSGKQFRGGKIYQKYCSVCHGISGESDGFNTYNLIVKPIPFSEELPKMSDQDLIRFIKYGSLEYGRSRYCPPWGNNLDEKEINLLITFLRNLQGENDSSLHEE
jgi:hypothetical protein